MGQTVATQTAVTTPAAVHQLTIEDAIRAGEVGMEQAAGSADRATPGWTDIAYEFLIRFIADKEFFWPWELTRASVAAGMAQPPDTRAWGGVYQRAARAKLIEKGSATARHPERHGSLVLVWMVRENVSNETVNAALRAAESYNAVARAKENGKQQQQEQDEYAELLALAKKIDAEIDAETAAEAPATGAVIDVTPIEVAPVAAAPTTPESKTGALLGTLLGLCGFGSKSKKAA